VPAVNEMHFGAQGFVLSRHSRPKPWRKITYNRMFRDRTKKRFASRNFARRISQLYR
jgi:hypothetical protein